MDNTQRSQWMQQQLQEKLNATLLEIRDDSAKHHGHKGAEGGAGHFSVTISSPLFAEKPLISCHRMVYEALDSAMPQEIHALKIKVVR